MSKQISEVFNCDVMNGLGNYGLRCRVVIGQKFAVCMCACAKRTFCRTEWPIIGHNQVRVRNGYKKCFSFFQDYAWIWEINEGDIYTGMFCYVTRDLHIMNYLICHHNREK